MNKTAEKVGKLLIGEKVKQLYTQQALSQKELAAKAGVAVKTIQRLENGEHAKGDTLQRIANKLDIPVTEFTMLNLDNGRIMQMSSQELNGLKMSLNGFVENEKINREEYQEMRQLIEMAEKGNVEFALPPLPPASKEIEATPNELVEPLEKFDLLDIIKRAFTETKPWVKYAPVDKTQPTLAHQLREQGFVSQPFISDFGPYRVGFFKREFSFRREFSVRLNSPSLYLAINKCETAEGVVIRLCPTRVNRHGKHDTIKEWPFVTIYYRSKNDNHQTFNVNLELFEIESNFDTDNEFLPKLLNAIIMDKPNFVLTGGQLRKSFGTGAWSENSYTFERLIRIERMKPIEIAWVLDFYPSDKISLKYYHPVRAIFAPAITPRISVEIEFSRDYSSANWPSSPYKSNLTITWPNLKNLLKPKKVDLIALTDAPTSNTNDEDDENKNF